MKTSPKAKKMPPVKVPTQPKRPAWLELPEHLGEFSKAVEQERKACVKLLTDAMESYDDAVYDAAIDAAKNKIGPAVLAAMNAGREAILAKADDILAIACTCAEDHVPAMTVGSVLARAEEDDPRNLGELIGASLSDMRSLSQDMACKSLVGSLSSDAREALLNALLP